jgi:uncharacterized protein (DUF433 family)
MAIKSPSLIAADPSQHDWWTTIVHTPGVCSGRARIDGTRIKVKHIFRWVEEQGMKPAEVVSQYPHLTLAQVYAALAYYWSHTDEIAAEIDEEDRLVEDLKTKSGPSKLQARLADFNVQNDPLSSR